MIKNNEVKVSVRCRVYNHEPYLRQCLDGFIMQKTNFRFEAIVHDDASTDDSASIIREYAEKYPDLIKPIYETENQYSKHDGSLRRIMDENTRGKYVAVCEGDDYWTDENKLQRQYDFMEDHPNHSLCFHAHINEYSDGSLKEERRYHEDIENCPMKDMILKDGGFMATNSMFFRTELVIDRPKWTTLSVAGDISLMLLLATKGKVGYINSVMSSYRVRRPGSWTLKSSQSPAFRKEVFRRSIAFFDAFDEVTQHCWHSIIERKKINIRLHYYLSRFKLIKNIADLLRKVK